MSWKLSGDGSGLLSREFDIQPALDWVKDHPTNVLIGLGIGLRVWEYLGNRSYWLDEGSLLGNLAGKAIFDFSGTFSGDQLAPFGFMVIERFVHRIFDYETYSMRLFPLLCGIAALVLFGIGTGSIRGFAVTLTLGILTSMFTAIMGSRALINLIYGGRRVSRLSI